VSEETGGWGQGIRLASMPHSYTKTWPSGPESQDPEYLEEAQHDAEDNSDMRVWNAGMSLADFECRHGSLPEDPVIECDCWGRDPNRLPADLVAPLGSDRPRAALYTLAYKPFGAKPSPRLL
jgi:hypothetical protein